MFIVATEAPPPVEQSEHEITFEIPQSRNVSANGRILSTIGGAWLVLHALRHGGLSGIALAGAGGLLLQRGVTGHCALSEKLGIRSDFDKRPEPQEFYERSIHVSQAFTINKPKDELFRYWRNFENLPQFMTHLLEVKMLDDKHSHWKAKAPIGMAVEWDAEILNEDPGNAISWRSLDGADIHSAGSVRFVDAGDRGTEVRVVLNYISPVGKLGKWVARIFGEEPSQQIREDLRHFKQLMETGEIPTSAGPRGKCRRANSIGVE